MSVPVAQRTVELPDVDFLATVTVYDYYVEFVLYDIVSRNGNVPLLRRSGTNYEETEKPEEADVYLHGSVKWDGCSNWHFDEQDRVMLHGCSRGCIKRFGDAMAACWDMASVLCPNFDR